MIETEGVAEQPQRGSDRIFRLDGEHVTLSGVENGPVLFESNFRQFCSIVEPDLGWNQPPSRNRAGSAASSVAAYVDLPGGTFSVDDVYPQQVSFGLRGMARQCLAKAVMFRADANGETVDIRTEHGFIRIRANAVLRINNDPVVATGAAHVHMYASLLTDASYVAEPITTGAFCSAPPNPRRDRRKGRSLTVTTDGLTATPTGETAGCSNSTYP